ncbi:MAG: hypothetical protein VX640_06395 [Pseudomonadota bacterium]|nr:hypothetical protein [Pseudomonadota bacterium]
MKSNAPWSVKGIERDARETAKEAARREGMTVGEWLSQVIYTAGDPASSDGEIEGIKISDLVKAIEHLNKRVISAESKSAAAMDDLARNFGGVVERLQRVERGRPAAGAPGADIEARLARLEEKTNDRQRIDTLKALEKAVGQVALQFDAAQKSSLARIESTERQLQQLASRLDTAGVADDGAGAMAAIDHLKDAIDGMSARLARAERIASEATQLKAEAAETVDADFVERTGKRLRVLGDEIKRGGDQIRSLEALVKKLSEQIDGAERRSSEGVQKVAETIAELRTKFSDTEQADSGRAEIEAAVAAATRRADERIAELQRSFEEMVARVGNGKPQAADDVQAEAVDEEAPEPADAEATFDEPHGDDELHAEEAGDDDEPEEAAAAAFDLEDDIGLPEPEDDDDAFSFDLDEVKDSDDAEPDYAAAILSEVEDAFSGVRSPSEAPQTDGDDSGLDAILAELEGEKPDEPSAASSDPEPLRAVPVGDSSAFLRAARRAAKEAAETAESRDQLRRKLTPRQRAILAAKIRRKRLAEQGLSLDDAADRASPPPAPASPAESPVSYDRAEEETEKEEGRPSVTERISGLFGAAARRLPLGKPKDETVKTVEAHADAEDDFAPLEADRPASEPNITAGAMKAAAVLRAKPVTTALGVAILLAIAALFFLVKDLMFGGGAPAPTRASSPPATTPDAGLSRSAETAVPEVPAAPTIQPRALYLESVAKLKRATTDAETGAAIEELTKAATLGHPPAQLQLGELYKLGQGVKQDPAQARAWFERAATGGNVLAMHRAGVMAARGQGGPADPQAAVAWFEKASKLGLVDSQYNLGAIFHPGGDAANASYQDAGQAYFWYSLAAKNGDQQAGSLAAGLAKSLTTEQRRAFDEAVAKWKAETPDPDANEIASAS